MLFGIPVALLGIIGYGFILIATVLKEQRFLWLSTIAGFVFSLYLTGLEAFVLHAWCLLCITSQLLILFILIFASYGYFLSRRGK